MRILFASLIMVITLSGVLDAEDTENQGSEGPLLTSTAWPQFGGPERNFQSPELFHVAAHNPTKVWQRTLGDGMSGVVTDGEACYTSYLVPISKEESELPESERSHREALVAMDCTDGKVQWVYEYDAGWIEEQQAFGGRKRAPQATPVIIGRSLIGIGFTGLMHSLDRETGKVLWKVDLFERFGGPRVQFGYSSSPVPFGEYVLVLAGGQRGGLVCLDAATGKEIWNTPCKEASYATPIIWNRPDGRQIVFMTRNRVIGVNADNGSTLWEYRLPGEGLTNVPTPLAIDDVGLIISGQGVKGTRRLDIVREGSEYTAKEAWQSSAQYFYCNWVLCDETLIGCDGDLLLALDVQTGKTLGKFRGYRDTNLIRTATGILAFHGDGDLSTLEIRSNEFRVTGKYHVFEARCWTPPTLLSNHLWCRGDDQLIYLNLGGGDPRAAVVASKIRKPVLLLEPKLSLESEPSQQSSTPPDALQAILSAFESQGAERAWMVYNQWRDNDADSLSIEQRRRLVELAKAEGLDRFAKQIAEHLAADFPKELENEKAKTPSQKTTRGKNGLVYLELGVRNVTNTTIQAYVKGPGKHPFSYGLPLPVGRVRLENWPVGTKLYRTEAGVRKEVLLVVEKQMAGQVFDVPKDD